MKTRNTQANIFDVITLGLIVVVVGLIVYTLFIYKPKLGSERIILTIRVPAENIEKEAQLQKEVYFNGTNSPVVVKSVTREGNFFLITLEGAGETENGAYFFNGQRILIGQKSEIHSTYFAQGVVTEIKHED